MQVDLKFRSAQLDQLRTGTDQHIPEITTDKLPKSFHFVTNSSKTSPVPLEIAIAQSKGIQIRPSLRRGLEITFLRAIYVVHAAMAVKNRVKTRGRRKTESWGRVKKVARKLRSVSVRRSPKHEASGGEMLSETQGLQLQVRQGIWQ